MGTLSNATFVSLDGVVNHMERWHFDYMDGESDALADLDAATAMVMGRNTYEVYAGVWPGREDEYADAINAIPKYVASSTLTEPSWHTSTVLPGQLVEAVRALREPDDASLLMHGYGLVAKKLLEADLLDVLHLWVHPTSPASASRPTSCSSRASPRSASSPERAPSGPASSC